MKVRDLMTLQFQIVREEGSLLQTVQRLRECPLVEDELGIKSVIVLDPEATRSSKSTELWKRTERRGNSSSCLTKQT